ncbi:hypothetical protein HQ45_00745 [Porphyromonas crevioricanis]|nr:hypothetical protein [Porphyromonas crevioricanis]KGN91333.1 hypothetical protein HQ45_00745 [Porphyromonas crevioricanis]KGN94329.1 hypothetical protein HQ38_05890 [Porphyromonas crevioricanis]GAD07377.1 hypothetical protein PORCAN_997 [Porphyromonas crevioricanis JCM 13913]
MRYAAHYLLCKGYCLRWPLVGLSPNGNVSLDLFERETHSVAFYPGVLELRPLNEEKSKEGTFLTSFSVQADPDASIGISALTRCIELKEMRQLISTLSGPFSLHLLRLE